MKSKLGKGIIIVLIANIVNMMFNVLTNLILPKELSVDAYAAIKTYQLYMSYIGILHLGYNDGMYLKYGGKRIEKINKDELVESLSTIRIFQLVIMILGVIVSIMFDDYIFLMVAFAVLPTNLLSYYQFFYQACGEFSVYGRIINGVSIGTFVINFLLIFAFHTDNYILYLAGYVGLNLVVWSFIEFYFHKKTKSKLRVFYFSFDNLLSGMHSGILLTLGNFSSIFMTTIDRWFVKIFIGTLGFAQFAFAVSMANLLYVATTPITITLYNYFCNNDSKEGNERVRNAVIVFSVIIVAVAFPVKFIMETYLIKYIGATTVLFLIFASQMFYVLIKGIYVNLYKARLEQKKYFNGLILVIAFGVFMNVICYIIYRQKEAFAIGTLISSIVWLFICQRDFRDMKLQEYLYMATQLATFLICGILFNSIVGFLLYVVITILSTYLLMRPVFTWGIDIVKDINSKLKASLSQRTPGSMS